MRMACLRIVVGTFIAAYSMHSLHATNPVNCEGVFGQYSPNLDSRRAIALFMKESPQEFARIANPAIRKYIEAFRAGTESELHSGMEARDVADAQQLIHLIEKDVGLTDREMEDHFYMRGRERVKRDSMDIGEPTIHSYFSNPEIVQAKKIEYQANEQLFDNLVAIQNPGVREESLRLSIKQSLSLREIKRLGDAFEGDQRSKLLHWLVKEHAFDAIHHYTEPEIASLHNMLQDAGIESKLNARADSHTATAQDFIPPDFTVMRNEEEVSAFWQLGQYYGNFARTPPKWVPFKRPISSENRPHEPIRRGLKGAVAKMAARLKSKPTETVIPQITAYDLATGHLDFATFAKESRPFLEQMERLKLINIDRDIIPSRVHTGFMNATGEEFILIHTGDPNDSVFINPKTFEFGRLGLTYFVSWGHGSMIHSNGKVSSNSMGRVKTALPSPERQTFFRVLAEKSDSDVQRFFFRHRMELFEKDDVESMNSARVYDFRYSPYFHNLSGKDILSMTSSQTGDKFEVLYIGHLVAPPHQPYILFHGRKKYDFSTLPKEQLGHKFTLSDGGQVSVGADGTATMAFPGGYTSPRLYRLSQSLRPEIRLLSKSFRDIIESPAMQDVNLIEDKIIFARSEKGDRRVILFDRSRDTSTQPYANGDSPLIVLDVTNSKQPTLYADKAAIQEHFGLHFHTVGADIKVPQVSSPPALGPSAGPLALPL